MTSSVGYCFVLLRFYSVSSYLNFPAVQRLGSCLNIKTSSIGLLFVVPRTSKVRKLFELTRTSSVGQLFELLKTTSVGPLFELPKISSIGLFFFPSQDFLNWLERLAFQVV